MAASQKHRATGTPTVIDLFAGIGGSHAARRDVNAVKMWFCGTKYNGKSDL